MSKLIILFNLSGSYKGGAQKRYLRLFSYFQRKGIEYHLLLNKSLYEAIYKDGILVDRTNVHYIKTTFDKVHQPSKIEVNTKPIMSGDRRMPDNKNKLVLLLGKVKYFCKCTCSVVDYSWKLWKFLLKNKFSSVYCIFHGGIWSSFLFKFLNIKYIYSYNDTNFSTVKKGFINTFKSEYFAIKNAYIVDCLSPYIAKGLTDRFPKLDKTKFLITPNSFINYENYFPANKKENWISFCSRLEILKNPHLLLEAIVLIKEQVKDYKVKIIGNGGEYSRLCDGIKKYGLEGIIELCGPMESSAPIVSRSKIFVSVQQDNNYPSQSLLEAMACENAIIASDVGETRMFVTENEGVLIPLDAQALADAILQLINDEEHIKVLGKAARHKATTEHTIEKFAKYFINITNI